MIVEQLARGAVETRQVSHHAVKPWRDEVSPLREQTIGDALLYSKSPIPSLTLKLIVDGCQATPRRSSSRSKFG